MMALGSARTLQPTDMWKMDEKRSARILAGTLTGHYERRTEEAKIYNERLLDPTTPLPRSKRILYSMLPHREKREHDYRTKWGKKRASLKWSLNDTFGNYFWWGCLFKLVGDTATACTPLVIRAIIAWSREWQFARDNGLPEPSQGRAVGMAVGLLLMLVVASVGLHHFFIRSTGTGVYLRAAIITSVYDRSLRLTQKSRGELPNGKLVNHISTDTSRIDFAAGFYGILYTAPIQFLVITIILIIQLKYSALPGIAFLLVATPAQATIMKKLFMLRKRSMVWTDKRAKLLQEILGGMRIVKFMAWEIPFLNRIGAIRNMELGYVRTLLVYRSGMMAVAMSLPILAAILAFITYVLTSHELDPATVFATITLFQLMRMPLMMWPMCLSATADAQNALSRLEVVFDAEVISEGRHIDPNMKDGLRIEHASFTWDAAPVVVDDTNKKLQDKQDKANGIKVVKEPKAKRQLFKKKAKTDSAHVRIAAKPQSQLAEASTFGGGVGGDVEANGEEEEIEDPNARIFRLKDIDLTIPRGSLTAVVGAIGSGKSSLLQGLVGEMRRTEGKVSFSGTTSLCAQSPWIQNATVRENIVFGQPWDEDRYWAAVRDSCLEPDLELLEDGDSTEIGEKGINLSGGQKQRVNIARAIYFNSDIIALDDPLSALDAGVGKALFFNAILGALSGKTRILVTHALHFLPHVDNIILMEDGRITETGTYAELKANGKSFARLIREFGSEDQHSQQLEDEETAIERAQPSKHIRSNMVAKGVASTLMQQEERNAGSMRKGTYSTYLKAGKGFIMVPVLLFCVVLAQGFFVMTSFWLVYWQERQWGLSDGVYMGVSSL
jgi:ABC-type multidrug transport system fused ATPase/permease subunit